MKRIASGLIAAGTAGFLMAATATAADEPFNAQKFFDELGDRGGSMPANFNGKAFMEDLKSKGISKTNRIGPTQFFAELKSRGVSLPSNFNQAKFIQDSERKGIAMPDMVDWHRNF